jgi:hypothetical protein
MVLTLANDVTLEYQSLGAELQRARWRLTFLCLRGRRHRRVQGQDPLDPFVDALGNLLLWCIDTGLAPITLICTMGRQCRSQLSL